MSKRKIESKRRKIVCAPSYKEAQRLIEDLKGLLRLRGIATGSGKRWTDGRVMVAALGVFSDALRPDGWRMLASRYVEPQPVARHTKQRDRAAIDRQPLADGIKERRINRRRCRVLGLHHGQRQHPSPQPSCGVNACQVFRLRRTARSCPIKRREDDVRITRPSQRRPRRACPCHSRLAATSPSAATQLAAGLPR